MKLPRETTEGDNPRKCGLLKKNLYGTRDAGHNFELKVRDVLTGAELTQGTFSPCVYHHKERKTCLFHWGDDFVIAAPRKQGEWVEQVLSGVFIVRCSGILGPGPQDDREVRILNRLMRWYTPYDAGSERIEFEADPRHMEILCAQVGLQPGKSKAVATPGVKGNDPTEGPDAEGIGTREFRSAAMRACYLAADRPELQYAAKECARAMQRPTTAAWEAVKRMARYLLGAPRVVWIWRRQRRPEFISGFADSDWAGQRGRAHRALWQCLDSTCCSSLRRRRCRSH